jgi:hypothetical protein
MNDLARQIIGHYKRHAAAWDADPRSSAWNANLGTTASS